MVQFQQKSFSKVALLIIAFFIVPLLNVGVEAVAQNPVKVGKGSMQNILRFLKVGQVSIMVTRAGLCKLKSCLSEKTVNRFLRMTGGRIY